MYVPNDFISLKLGLCLLQCDAMWPGKDLSAIRKNLLLPQISILMTRQSMFCQKSVNFYQNTDIHSCTARRQHSWQL